MSPVLAASVALFRDGKVLLGQRAAPSAHGLWTLPGGRVEAGELLADAAARELAEETGSGCTIVGPADIVEFFERDAAGALRAHYVIVAFAARWQAPEPQAGDELSAVRWVSPHDLDGLPVTDSLQRVIDRAAALLAEVA